MPEPRLLHLGKKETSKARAAYAEYEAMGSDRSLTKLAKKLGKPSGYTRHLEMWSSTYSWVERVSAYDEKQQAEKRRKREAAREEMDERQALIGRSHLLRAVKRLDTLLARDGRDGFGPYATVLLFKAAAELERAALTEEVSQVRVAVHAGEDGTDVYIETQWGTKRVASEAS